MPNIADSLQCKKFVEALEACERDIRRGNRTYFDRWERDFVASMRNQFDGREDMIDMGVTPWNPTARQWNQLMDLQRRVES